MDSSSLNNYLFIVRKMVITECRKSGGNSEHFSGERVGLNFELRQYLIDTVAGD
jgi:hypothetical protein